MAGKRAVNKIKDFDTILYYLSDRHLHQWGARVVELIGEGFFTRQPEPEEAVDPNDPYVILGVREGADMIVVKAAYLSLMREYHPDGKHPDATRAVKINEAYERICRSRAVKK
jgi:hypothetical protein